MKKHIMGNFKMNFDNEELKSYLKHLNNILQETKNEVVIFPSYTGLDLTNTKLKKFFCAFWGTKCQ